MFSVSQYAYINARLRSRLVRRLSAETHAKLLEAPSVDEAIILLKDTFYDPLYRAYQNKGDLLAVESEMQYKEVQLFSHLSTGLPTNIKNLMNGFLLGVEINNLKMILRLWFNHAIMHKSAPFSLGNDANRLNVVYNIDYEQVLSANGWDALAESLSNTPYKALVKQSSAACIRQKSLYTLEIALDQYQFSQLNKAVKTLKGTDALVAKRFIGAYIDLENVLCGMRLVQRRISEAEINNYFISGGYRLNFEQWKELISDTKLFKITLHNWYPQLIDTVDDEKQLVDRARYLQLVQDGKQALSSYPFSSSCIIAYFFLMRDDLRRVLTALHSRYYKLSSAKVKEML